MALNYSHRPVSPAHISESNLLSPMRTVNGYLAESASERYGEDYSRPWHSSHKEMEDCHFCCRREKIDHCCSPASNSKDIIDLLPSDPFEMDIETTFTAITGWLEDLEVDYGEYVRSNGKRSSQGNYDLFAGWNLIWSNALKSQPFPRDIQSSNIFQVYEKPYEGVHSIPHILQFDEKPNNISMVSENGEISEMECSLASYDIEYQQACDERGVMSLSNESTSCSHELQFREKVEGAVQSDKTPHEAFKFCLLYLGLKDLLSVERVCSSLHSEIRGDPLLWRSIHIDEPLNEKITDDLLLKLTSRANGDLLCLSLVACPKITDDGIRRILENNQRLTKLFVPGCTRLTIEGILNNIRAHNSNNDVKGIKHLRIGGHYGVAAKHFEELKFLLGSAFNGDDEHRSYHKPHFYHGRNFYLPYNDDRAIDIEMCPICENYRLVYDCPAEGCQVKDKSSQVCRACVLCIIRCAQCGRCINNNEYEETFYLEFFCSDCYRQLVHDQYRLDKKADHVELNNEPSNHLTDRA